MGRMIIFKKKKRVEFFFLEHNELSFCYDDDDLSIDNYPIKTIDNENGKIMIAAVGQTRLAQLALEKSRKIIKKNQKITYKYLKNEFLNKLISEIEKNHIQSIRNEYGQPDAQLMIVITQNGLVYKIGELNYVSENDTSFASNANLQTYVYMTEDNGFLNDTSDVFKVIKAYNAYIGAPNVPIFHMSNEDYKIRIRKEA